MPAQHRTSLRHQARLFFAQLHQTTGEAPSDVFRLMDFDGELFLGRSLAKYGTLWRKKRPFAQRARVGCTFSATVAIRIVRKFTK